MGRRKDPSRTQELLDACCEYIERHGLADLTLRPLAVAVGVSPRTLLYHFGSREQLIIATIRRSRERGLADVAQLVTRTRTGLDVFGPTTGSIGTAIETVAAAIWDESLSERSRPFLLLFYEAYLLGLRHPNTYRQLLEQLAGEANRLFGEVLHRAGVPADTADRVASQLVAVHRGLQLEWLATGRTEQLTAAHRQAIARIISAIDYP